MLFGSKKVKDPVCGMEIDPKKAAGGSTAHGARIYYFCNPVCKETFVREPDKWAKK